ncbi:methyltransferase [Streptomyces sp. UNOC14_S4]|uniref:methyltransferase n=1 Tax=Streptomyces sp. UNOC14_S4 TaxID=2872340 RepID=UPI001E2D1479|nr:methyltransferase [Streptomyces sp. UNOC14_S4]MCC3768532.1 methyltransferase [Streptomyces sp. UNOC14_S4]
MNRLMTSSGEYELARFPEDPRDRLRAWDSADEYLLDHLQGGDGGPADLSGSVVIVGDRWGALAVALAGHRPVQITDSFLTQEATRANLARNGFAPDAVRLCSTQDAPPERIDVLLIRVPKSLALLEDQLHRLAPHVHEGTLVVGTGRVTEIHTSTLTLFERILGPTRTSLAVKKSRLILCSPDPGLGRGANPWPHSYALPEDVGVVSGRTVVNHAGVFCAERLDIGTRFFLGHLPELKGAGHVVDLGCGNGVVGTAVALADPAAEVTFVDESFQAVASAEDTFRANLGPEATARFRVGDGMSGVPAGSVDLVLNNPPFHSHQATTDVTARRMFAGARDALRTGGELWVVGNRHLGYHVRLRRLFGNCEVVASDPKFVVLRAVKR